MAVQRAVAERWKQVTGVTLIEAYGLTETSPAACMNPMGLSEFNGSIGLPISSTDACVKNEEGEILATGEVGELCIKGPQVMAGYWQRPEDTAQVIDTMAGCIPRSEEHTSELQSLMRTSYAVFCLKKKIYKQN